MLRLGRFVRHRVRDDERGIFLVWFALTLTLLLAMAGFAVDFWRWNDEEAKLQKAADAAALAGAVYQSVDPPLAQSTAIDNFRRNGYVDGQDQTSISFPAPPKANQLKVRISKTVKNYFGGLVGVSNTTITKTAVAEYQKAINMGSPINQFGNDPQLSSTSWPDGSTRYPDFWANVFGPDSPKGNGDAILSENCSGSTDNCVGGVNSDNQTTGYFYGIDIGTAPPSPLTVQAFDPAFAHVGDRCTDSSANLAGAMALSPFSYTFDGVSPSTRYSNSSTSRYCTGDQYYDNSGTEVPWTTYTLRGPDDTPNTPLDNPVICSVNFPGYRGNIATALQSNTNQSGAPTLFRNYFRRWYTLCTINNPTESSTYFLQIQTKTRADGTAAPDGGGANRLALRAGLNSSYTTTKARIYGNGLMSIYANAEAANTTFHLARVTPSAFPRVLVLNFFDVGDAASAGTLKVIPSPDVSCSSCVNSTSPRTFGKSPNVCSYTAPPGNSSGPPYASSYTNLTACTITNVSSSNYQAQWITVRIPIPAYDASHLSGYNCNASDPNGCWALINFAFPSSVNDTTTWSANVAGAPLRIVE